MFISSHLVRGDISEASITLGRSNQLHYLKLAAQLAKLAGHNTFATHIEARVKAKESEIVLATEDELKDLPSRIEALLNKSDNENTESEEESDREIGIEHEKAVNRNGVGNIKFVEITDPSAAVNGNVPATNMKVLDEDVLAVISNGADDIKMVEITDTSAALNGNVKVLVEDVDALNSNGAGDIKVVEITDRPASLNGNGLETSGRVLVEDVATISSEDTGAKAGEE